MLGKNWEKQLAHPEKYSCYAHVKHVVNSERLLLITMKVQLCLCILPTEVFRGDSDSETQNREQPRVFGIIYKDLLFR